MCFACYIDVFVIRWTFLTAFNVDAVDQHWHLRTNHHNFKTRKRGEKMLICLPGYALKYRSGGFFVVIR